MLSAYGAVVGVVVVVVVIEVDGVQGSERVTKRWTRRVLVVNTGFHQAVHADSNRREAKSSHRMGQHGGARERGGDLAVMGIGGKRGQSASTTCHKVSDFLFRGALFLGLGKGKLGRTR